MDSIVTRQFQLSHKDVCWINKLHERELKNKRLFQPSEIRDISVDSIPFHGDIEKTRIDELTRKIYRLYEKCKNDTLNDGKYEPWEFDILVTHAVDYSIALGNDKYNFLPGQNAKDNEMITKIKKHTKKQAHELIPVKDEQIPF